MKELFESLLADARMAFVSEQYKTALNKADRAFAVNPESDDAALLAGHTALVLNENDKAEAYYRAALERNPQGDTAFYLGSALLAQGRRAEALSTYAKAEQLGCSEEIRKKLFYVIGTINREDGDDASALENFEKSSQLKGSNEDEVDMLLQRCRIYTEQGDLKQAENCAVQVKLLQPSLFLTYHLLFQIYVQQQKLREAKNLLKEAEDRFGKDDPGWTELMFDKAALLCLIAERAIAAGQDPKHLFEQAAGTLEALANSGLLSEKDRCETVITRAEIALNLNKTQQADALAATVADLEDEALAEYIERAQYVQLKAAEDARDFSRVQDVACRLRNAKTPFFVQLSYYAEAYAEKQLAGTDPERMERCQALYAKAIAYYRSCTVSQPGDFMAYLFRAKSYVDIGRFDDAKELAALMPEDGRKTLEAYIDQAQNEEA